MINEKLIDKIKNLVGIKQKNPSKNSFRNWHDRNTFTQNNFGKLQTFNKVADNDADDKPKNSFHYWHKSNVQDADGNSVTHTSAYESYCTHCEGNGTEPLPVGAFHKKMSETGLMSQRIAGRPRYIGIKLKDSND